MDLKTVQSLMYRATGMIVLGHRLVYAPAKGRGHSCYINDGALAAFGDVAIAREREACAKLCDDEGLHNTAAAIRARGQA